MSETIDAIYKKILKLLRGDARIPNAEIAKKVGMAPSAVLERIRKLERKGVIAGYETRIDAESLGVRLTTLVLIKTNETVGSMDLGDELAKLPEVLAVYCVAGEFSYLCKVCVKDVREHTGFLVKIGKIPGVIDSQTTLVMKTIKDAISVDPSAV